MGCLFTAAVLAGKGNMDSLQAQKRAYPYHYVGASVPGNLTSSVNGFQQMKHMRVHNGYGEGEGEDDDVFSVLHRQHSIQIDNLISQHEERIKMEVLGSKWRLMKQVAATVEVVTRKRIKTKDEEINRAQQLNAALEDRIRFLSGETKIWRDIATTNENAVVALRLNLEQALAHQNQPQNVDGGDEDAESCCDNPNPGGRGSGGRCKVCAKEEPCVLFLPCKHLCLCSGCSTEIVLCPICYCAKQYTLRIKLT